MKSLLNADIVEVRDNVISTCYVINIVGYGPEPTVYLKNPPTHSYHHATVIKFDNVFSARAYIKCAMPMKQIKMI